MRGKFINMKTSTIRTLYTMFFLHMIISSCSENCESTAKCQWDPDPGECKAAFTKFYFDQETGQCREFIWGGCNGTVPFDTLEECQACQCNQP